MKVHAYSSRWFRRTVAAVLTLTALTMVAQSTAPNSTRLDGKKLVPYRINRLDQIAVSVFDEPQLTGGNHRVDSRGMVDLPLIDPVRVYGLTITEAATAIENAYKDGRILRNPQVTVLVEQYSPRVVNVVGKVKFPARVELPPEEQWTIKDVITKCGGFDDTARGTGVRLTRIMPDGSAKTFTLDVQSAILGKDKASSSADAAFIVEPGDDIYVPEKII
jgi:polysaccharide biosynthesis/export protein